LAGETVLYGLGQILPRVFHFLVFSTYLTYRLNDTPGEYAIYLDLYAYASVLIVLFSYRMDTAFFRFGTKDLDQERVYHTGVIPMIGSSLLLVALGYIFSDTLATWLTYPGRGYYVRWFSVIIALDVLALLPMARLRLQSRAKVFVIFKVANVVITVLLVLLCLEVLPRLAPQFLSEVFPFIQSDIDYVFISNLIASALMLLGLLMVYPVKRLDVDWKLWGNMVGYAWPLIIVGIAGSINQFFGVPLQKFFLGADFESNKNEAAVYGAVQKIPALLAMFTTAYNYAAEPFFFRNADRSDAKDLYGDIALFFIMACGAAALGIHLYIDLFQFIIGPSFRSGLYLVPILLMSYLLLGVYYNVSIWYKLSDNTLYGAGIATIGAIITVGGSIFFLQTVGIVASAYSSLACYSVAVILAYVIGQRKYPINYPVKWMLFMLGFITLLMYIGSIINTDSLVTNLASGTFILVIYLGISYIIGRRRLRRLSKA